jgi:predicted nucleotidyltransferase
MSHHFRRGDSRARERGDQTAIDRLGDYFARAAAPGVVSAYIFGSHADGRTHEESDLDAAVLLDRTIFADRRARADLRVWLTSELMAATGQNRVDLVVLNDAPPELARHVVTRGRCIFLSDAAQEHAFTRDIQLLAGDLMPWLARMRRIKLEALRR